MDDVSCPDFVKQPDCVFVFDANAFLHRAMHVCYADRAPTIAPTDAAFVKHAGKMIANVLHALNVRQMVVALDSTEHSFRCDWYPAYKAQRKPHTPVFAAQAPRFFDALRRAGVMVVGEARYEADDVIASMVMARRDFPVCIISSDKDLLQHVGSDVVMYDAMKDVFMDARAAEEKFGVCPDQIADYLGLVGDPGDGIPGVPSVGAKTAAKLLRKFGTLDAMYAVHRDLATALSAKQFATVMEHQETALLSRRLAQPTIWSECPKLTCETDGLRAPEPIHIRRVTEALG
jgi:5'-3' exonuclease